MYRQCRSRGYATVVDVLMDIGVLDKAKYEDWRFGRIPYLERVCTINLSKLSTIRHQMRVYAVGDEKERRSGPQACGSSAVQQIWQT